MTADKTGCSWQLLTELLSCRNENICELWNCIAADGSTVGLQIKMLRKSTNAGTLPYRDPRIFLRNYNTNILKVLMLKKKFENRSQQSDNTVSIHYEAV